MKNKNLFLTSILATSLLISCQSSEKSESSSSDDNKTEQTENSTNENADDMYNISSWIEHENIDGKYSIKLPGKPEHSSLVEPTAVGDITIELDVYEESATKVYLVGYNDYPSGIFDNVTDEERNEALDNAIGGSTGALGLDLIEEETELELDGIKGKMVKAKSSSNSFHAHYKVYLHKNRLYQVAILRDGSYPVGEKSEAFFSSFKIIQ